MKTYPIFEYEQFASYNGNCIIARIACIRFLLLWTMIDAVVFMVFIMETRTFCGWSHRLWRCITWTIFMAICAIRIIPWVIWIFVSIIWIMIGLVPRPSRVIIIRTFCIYTRIIVMRMISRCIIIARVIWLLRTFACNCSSIWIIRLRRRCGCRCRRGCGAGRCRWPIWIPTPLFFTSA